MEAQLEAFHNACLRQVSGLHYGPDGPSTAELLVTTAQTSMADLLRQRRQSRGCLVQPVSLLMS